MIGWLDFNKIYSTTTRNDKKTQIGEGDLDLILKVTTETVWLIYTKKYLNEHYFLSGSADFTHILHDYLNITVDKVLGTLTLFSRLQKNAKFRSKKYLNGHYLLSECGSVYQIC